MKTEEELNEILRINSNISASICRVCLTETIENVTSLFEIRDNLVISEKLRMCTQIQIDREDGLPSVLCKQCFEELNAADSFRAKCLYSDDLLRKIFKNSIVQQAGLKEDTLFAEIKQESTDDAEINTDDYDYKECDNIDVKKDDIDSLIDIKTELNESSIRYKKSIHKSKGHQTKKSKCLKCHKLLSSEKAVENHMRVMHGENDNRFEWKVTGYGAERRFHCFECDFSTPRKQVLQNHCRRHTGERPYCCSVCNKTFAQLSCLLKHARIHSDQMYYTCSQCGKQFKNKAVHDRHRLVHSDEKKFVCSLCNKGFKTKFSYECHQNRHLNIKNYSCDVCGSTFVTNSELVNHSSKHKDNISFQCDICKFQTKRKHRMKEHMARHTGTLPFPCPTCQWAFCSRWELIEHMRKHSKEKAFSCHYCDLTFRHRSSCRKHSLKVHGMKYSRYNDLKKIID